MNEANTEDISLEFVTGADAQTAVDGGTNLWLNEGQIQVECTVLKRYTSLPTPKPTAPARPTIAPVEPPAQEVTTGIKLVYDEAASNATTKVVKAQYVGFSDGIKGSTVELSIPADLASNIKSISGVSKIAGFSSQSTLDDVVNDNVYTFTAAA